jgi:hypothetical protein
VKTTIVKELAFPKLVIETPSNRCLLQMDGETTTAVERQVVNELSLQKIVTEPPSAKS